MLEAVRALSAMAFVHPENADKFTALQVTDWASTTRYRLCATNGNSQAVAVQPSATVAA